MITDTREKSMRQEIKHAFRDYSGTLTSDHIKVIRAYGGDVRIVQHGHAEVKYGSSLIFMGGTFNDHASRRNAVGKLIRLLNGTYHH